MQSPLSIKIDFHRLLHINGDGRAIALPSPFMWEPAVHLTYSGRVNRPIYALRAAPLGRLKRPLRRAVRQEIGRAHV